MSDGTIRDLERREAHDPEAASALKLALRRAGRDPHQPLVDVLWALRYARMRAVINDHMTRVFGGPGWPALFFDVTTPEDIDRECLSLRPRGRIHGTLAARTMVLFPDDTYRVSVRPNGRGPRGNFPPPSTWPTHSPEHRTPTPHVFDFVDNADGTQSMPLP